MTRSVRLPHEMRKRLAQLEAACEDSSSQQLRSALDDVRGELLEVALELGPANTLQRLAKMSALYRDGMTETNRWVDDRVRWWAQQHNGVAARATASARA